MHALLALRDGSENAERAAGKPMSMSCEQRACECVCAENAVEVVGTGRGDF